MTKPNLRIGVIGEEVWRPVNILGRSYAVSNLARFKRLEQNIKRSDGIVLHYNERLVKPVAGCNGRANVKITSKTFRLAHLVALAFIGKRPVNCVVSHRDGDYTNDIASNLEYTSYSRNTLNTADRIRVDNSSGIRGVSYDSHGVNPIWRGNIVVDGNSYTMASHNKEKVVAWRKEMEIKHKTDRRTA